MTTMIIGTVRNTDWALLAKQKQALIEAIRFVDGEGYEAKAEQLEGLLNWVDAIQGAAARAGLPVVWLETDKED